MIKRIHKVLLLFVVIFFVGCDNPNIKKEFYKTGELLSECEMKNNRKDGIEKTYYEDGKLFRISRYVNDTLNGRFWEYYKSGEIEIVGNFINGLVSGSYIEFYKSGKIKSTYLYYSSKEYSFGEFNEDGTVKDTIFFINIIVPDTLRQGDNVTMQVKWFNKNYFQEYEFVKGDLTEDGTGIFNKEPIIERTDSLDGDGIEIELPTQSIGFNYWNGYINGYFDKGGDKYAAFPIVIVYYVELYPLKSSPSSK